MWRTALLFPLVLGTASSVAAQYGAPVSYATAPAYAASDIDYAIADWRRLRQSDNYSFADYARFLIYNPGWPGETSLRRAAEKAMRPGENAGTVIAFFAKDRPVSGNGFARLADALTASGRSTEALAAARDAWASADLGAFDEQNLWARYGNSLTSLDHDRRADALLFARKPDDAARFLAFASIDRRPAFAARIAMQTRAPDAEAQYQQVAVRVASDAGLLMDRLRYLRDGNNDSYARWLAARPHTFTYRPADPERFYETLLAIANGAAQDRQWQTAYDIARQVDDAFAPGADISLKPLGVRDDYTSLTWLAGTVALDRLGRPASAIGMFDRYSHGGRSLQVLSKGYYWAGRAALAAGRIADSTAYFQNAAAYPELFYGQLALERLGRSVQPPAAIFSSTTTAAQRAAFAGKRLVRGLQRLMYGGRADEQTLFVRALAESLDNDADRRLAVELGQQIGRQDLPVWVARAARNKGSAFYVRQAFPLLASAPQGRLWSLTQGITRQESSFDRYALSHAGAKGLMQLMTGTAREQAGKMGVGFDSYRLSDPAYNVMLGSAYFARLLDTWGGSVPLAVAAYNAGSGNVRKWINTYGDPRGNVDVLKWIEAIPFTETKGYVQRVIENSVVYDSLNPSAPHQSAFHVSKYLGKSRPG